MDNTQIIASVAERVVTNVEKVIIGKRHEVEMTLIALLCEGHLLIEDVPGVGKTMLADPSPNRSGANSDASSSPPTCCRAT